MITVPTKRPASRLTGFGMVASFLIVGALESAAHPLINWGKDLGPNAPPPAGRNEIWTEGCLAAKITETRPASSTFQGFTVPDPNGFCTAAAGEAPMPQGFRWISKTDPQFRDLLKGPSRMVECGYQTGIRERDRGEEESTDAERTYEIQWVLCRVKDSAGTLRAAVAPWPAASRARPVGDSEKASPGQAAPVVEFLACDNPEDLKPRSSTDKRQFSIPLWKTWQSGTPVPANAIPVGTTQFSVAKTAQSGATYVVRLLKWQNGRPAFTYGITCKSGDQPPVGFYNFTYEAPSMTDRAPPPTTELKLDEIWRAPARFGTVQILTTGK